jgi:hypothetical protein
VQRSMLESINNPTSAEGGEKDTIPRNSVIDKLPADELKDATHVSLEPVSMHLPEKRLRAVAYLAVQGIISGQSPSFICCAHWSARRIWAGGQQACYGMDN